VCAASVVCLLSAILAVCMDNLVCMHKLKLNYDRQSVGQPVLVSGTHLGTATNFSLSLKFSLDSSRFVILWRPL
jgi:hypothetical protein